MNEDNDDRTNERLNLLSRHDFLDVCGEHALANLDVWDPILSQDLHIDEYKSARQKLYSDDWEIGLDHLEELAHKGSLLSMLLIADAMREGWLYSQDLEMAMKWYSVASESGSLHGVFGIGITHLRLARYSLAASFLTRAAEAGYPPALNALGGIYFRGDLGVRDQAKAADCWNRAIDAGHLSAKVSYSFQRARGRYGVFQVFSGVADYISARTEQDKVNSIPDQFDRIR